MNALELIGKVTAAALGRTLREGDRDKNATARFLLDRLTPEQVVSICANIYHNPVLSPSFEVHIPRSLVSPEMALTHDLPAECLTDQKATYWRNVLCEREALLIANGSDDQGQSLKELTTINAGMLKGYVEIWCQMASEGLPLTHQHIKHWEQSLKGLEATVPCSLMQFAEYVLQTRERILTENLPLPDALGWALPALNIPRDSGFFRSIPPLKRSHKTEWQKRFQQARQQRACFLEKQTPNRDILDDDELRKRFNDNRERIATEAHEAIQAFLKAQPGWSPESLALAGFEWESQGIGLLFALKQVKQDLAELTLDFYADEYPDVLSGAEVDYLQQFKKRKSKEPLDQDREFYEAHREALSTRPSLKAKWDKFIYGNPIECKDFIPGLLAAIARLLDQSSALPGAKQLNIRTHKEGSRSKWLELNADAALYFSTRYRGLPALFGAAVNWEVHHLFSYDQLILSEKAKGSKGRGRKKEYSRNTSTAKAANEIKFFIELHYASGGSQRKEEVQLLWRFDPAAIGAKLEGDLYRLNKNPFVSAPIYLEPVSQKGALQTLALDDTGTLQAMYRQERGTLIPAYVKDFDQKLRFEQELKQLDKFLASVGHQAIVQAWQQFSKTYQEALLSWQQNGISEPVLLQQAQDYTDLLNVLTAFAADDTSRQALWDPLFRLGHHHVADRCLGIIAPWHPLRLAALLIKDSQVAQLVKRLLQPEPLHFSDSRLFFFERIQELEHPYYPEIAAYLASPPEIVLASETLYDYSLMEPPVSKNAFSEDAHEDPNAACRRIKDVVGRYLELLPHEQSSLDLVLYNCDNALLPQTAIKQLSETYADSDVICQIMLRHRNRNKLTALYRSLIENSNQDENSIISSENTLDFMSRFRIGILPESPPAREHFGKPVDIVFLQDVISRQATIEWLPFRQHYTPEIATHVPARWSKRKPMAKGEKKGTHYLICPLQPEEGKAYLKALEYLLKLTGPRRDSDQSGYHVPVRQIYLENSNIRQTLEEVHRLGEWVVNYDDLLDRRQLKNFGVQVIRFQQRRTQGRNLLISSDASLSLLKVLVRRRLEELDLQLVPLQLDQLVQKLIEDANLVSGDLVLRAAKRGIFSKELIGVVLSLALLRAEIGSQQPMGIYFLDDYAAWLGQKEQRIADLLVLNPRGQGKERRLHIFVSEAKYVDASNAGSAALSSQNQLRDTLNRMNKALFDDPVCLDRELWLSRLGEMLLEGLGTQPDGIDFSLEAEAWRADLMRGEIPIQLHGFSHVFISGPTDLEVESQQLSVKHTQRAIQEIFSRESVQDLMRWYAQDDHQSIIALRKSLGSRKSFETLNIKHKPMADLVSPPTDGQEKDYSNPPIIIPQPLPAPVVPIVSPSSDTISPAPTSLPERQSDWPPPYLVAWLQREMSKPSDDESRLAEETAQRLRNALYSYELPAKILESRLTPNAILIMLQGSDQVTLPQIEKRQSQLLTTHALNIIYLSARPGVLVVAIERPQRQKISLVDTWIQRRVNRSSSGVNMNLVTGIKELDGELLYLNVESEFAGLAEHAPHTLIAGATGSGKSVLLQNLILDIAVTNPPEMAKIHLIDPKGVDYLQLEPLPHLGKGIIYEQEEAANLLNELVDEMEARYRRFREFRVTKLREYNVVVPPEQRLPAIWLVHDEFADWMMVEEYKEAVTTAVKRLGVKARAAGIHLIFAAQRPDANVLPPQLRDNLGNRLILKVESVGTSRIALGQEGAEKLLGRGHLAARLSGESDLIYAQVPFLTTMQINEVVALIMAEYPSTDLQDLEVVVSHASE